MRLAGLPLLVLSGCEVLYPRPETTDSCPLGDVPSCTVADPDEDDDGAADDCDPCPAIAAFQADDDGDGIGNECDPTPNEAGVCQERRFAGFRDDDGRWEDTTGWAFDGNAKSSLPTDDLVLLRSRELHGPGRIETTVVDGDHPMNQLVFAGTVILASATAGYFCALQPVGGGLGTMLIGRLASTGEQTVAESSTFSQTPGFVHRLQLTVTSSRQVRCTSHRSGTASPHVFDAEPEASLEFTDTSIPEAGSYGVLARGSLGELEYVELIPE